jgi:histidinol-phosphate aminotransferase
VTDNRDISGFNRREWVVAAGALGLAAPAAPAIAMATDGMAARLSLNENPFGPSPAVIRAITAALGSISRYADQADADRLVGQIAALEQVAPAQIVLGEILEPLGAFLASRPPAGGRFVYSVPGYTALIDAAAPLGGVGVGVPLDGAQGNDLAALARAIQGDTRALYLVNPHNPTGTLDAPARFDAFVLDAAKRTLVIVDEAYLDYDDLPGRSAVRFTRAGANVAVFRTLAKIHGLAGLPFGYVVAPQPLAEVLRVAGIGSVHSQSRLALAAASAALADRNWIADVRRRTLAGRVRLTAALDALGLAHSDSRANFVFFRSPGDAGAVRAGLADAGILVGRAFPPLGGWVRITVGTEAEVTRTIAALQTLLNRSSKASRS